MKLEYLPQGPNNSGLIRLYEYEQEDVRALRQAADELACGVRETILLSRENWLTPIGDCGLVWKRGSSNRGVRQLGPTTFECELSPAGWRDVEGFLEPFCDPETTGFQWLTTHGKIALLISQSGQW
jgi:hypothetical protein